MTPVPTDPTAACVFPTGPGELPFYCETHGDIRDKLTDDHCRTVRAFLDRPTDPTAALRTAAQTAIDSGDTFRGREELHAALASQADNPSGPDALDVERLARALAEVFDDPKGPYTMRMLAEIAAREYAALRESPDGE